MCDYKRHHHHHQASNNNRGLLHSSSLSETYLMIRQYTVCNNIKILIQSVVVKCLFSHDRTVDSGCSSRMTNCVKQGCDPKHSANVVKRILAKSKKMLNFQLLSGNICFNLVQSALIEYCRQIDSVDSSQSYVYRHCRALISCQSTSYDSFTIVDRCIMADSNYPPFVLGKSRFDQVR